MGILSKELFEQLTRELIDKGKLMEAGWVSLRQTVIPPDAPETQLTEMRMAFFGGAQHVFASIMFMFEEGSELTANDSRRIDLIHAELTEWVAQMKAQRKPHVQ